MQQHSHALLCLSFPTPLLLLLLLLLLFTIIPHNHIYMHLLHTQASINWLDSHFIYTKEQVEQLKHRLATEQQAVKEGTAKQEHLTSKWHWRVKGLNARGKC